MHKTTKKKIEVYLPEAIKQRIEALCERKGISLAEAARRALEMWVKNEHDS